MLKKNFGGTPISIDPPYVILRIVENIWELSK